MVTENFPSSQLDLISAIPTFGSWTSPEWTIGTMTSRQIHTLTIVAKVKDNVTAGTATNSVTNTQIPNQTVDDTLDDLDAEVQIIPIIADLSLTKTVDSALAKVGDVITFSITVKNDSDDPVSLIQIKDKLPANLTYSPTTVPPSGTTYNSVSGIWDLGATILQKNDTLTLELKATIDAIGKIVNTSEIIKANRADVDSTRDSSN